ncbi:MAG TPA: glutamine--fructose-6-phosphate transaminase (isomerizing) [Patescibacteria group bacterium]|nr:glutamine--fructose-6-phosphate transaminase (isomerizing) [Patescibacteria group bacterium]
MCGIVAYLGGQPALPILLRGLKRLEYRGYDSAGVALLDAGKITRVRSVGKIINLEEKLKNYNLVGSVGIAHTRWATHGGVTENNAHPHSDCTGDLTIVHNGIVENYREIKEKFLRGHNITSETDTEVLAHLIEVFYKGNLLTAVKEALKEVRGTYGLVAIHAKEPNRLIAARLGSPLAIGLDHGEYYIASDPAAMLAYTNQVIFLDDGEVAEITGAGHNIYNLDFKVIDKSVESIDWDEKEAEKQGYENFMLKEIYDQPAVLEDAIRGRYNLAEGTAHLGGLNMTEAEMRQIKKIYLIACGTASYAAMVGKYAFERLAGIPVEVEVASEFRYRDPIIDRETLVFGISQSGETADTLAALREAKRRGAFVRGIVNVVGSTIARETDGGTYIHAGPELAVASTKAYTNMVAILVLYALQFGRLNKISLATGERVLKALLEIPGKMRQVLQDNKEAIKNIALELKEYHNCYYLGRGINYPVALEGSLKLKEISYIHSEAYPGGEMKHGPIALLSKDFPVIAIMTKNQLYDKMRSNVEEVKARGAKIILIVTEGDQEAVKLADQVIYVPPTMEILEPLLNTLPLQLLAYHVALDLGRDVDRPRNLAKSVTVE